jgi:hypothetical protein
VLIGDLLFNQEFIIWVVGPFVVSLAVLVAGLFVRSDMPTAGSALLVIGVGGFFSPQVGSHFCCSWTPFWVIHSAPSREGGLVRPSARALRGAEGRGRGEPEACQGAGGPNG